jgi:hypothetical protein
MSATSIGDLLKATLLADGTVAGLLGTSPSGPSIFPDTEPQKVGLPSLTYQRISGQRTVILNGIPSAGVPRYQLDARAITKSGAQALGRAVRQALHAASNTTWTDGVVSVRAQVEFTDERDLTEEGVNGPVYRHSADYFITHGTLAGTL